MTIPIGSDLLQGALVQIGAANGTDVCRHWGRLDRCILQSAMFRYAHGFDVLCQDGYSAAGSIPHVRREQEGTITMNSDKRAPGHENFWTSAHSQDGRRGRDQPSNARPKMIQRGMVTRLTSEVLKTTRIAMPG